MALGVLIPPTGDIVEADYPDLDSKQKACMGDIQILTTEDDCTLYCNESGKLIPLPVNERATRLCSQENVGLSPDDMINGPMLVFGPLDSDGYVTDVPDKYRNLSGRLN